MQTVNDSIVQSSDETICVWELSKLQTGENSAPQIRSDKLGDEVVTSIYSPDGELLIVNTAEFIHLLDQNCHVLCTFKAHAG